MSLFEKQLKNREISDNVEFEASIDSIANAVMGIRLRDSLDQREIAESAIDEVLKYYHHRVKKGEIPSTIKTVDEQIEYHMRPFGIKSRSVILEKGWYRHAGGAMLGTLKEDGSAVALIPSKFSGYLLVNIKTGKRKHINGKTEALIDREALCFYEPLPQEKLKVKDLVNFMFRQVGAFDLVLYFVLIGLSAVLGLLAPMFAKWLLEEVLQYNSMQMFFSLAVFALCFSVARLFFRLFQELINTRLGVKQDIAVQAAMINRILGLPTSFFKSYSAGELSQRFNYLQKMCLYLFSIVGMTVLTSVFSLAYLVQIFVLVPSLALSALLIVAVTIVFLTVTVFGQMRVTREKMELTAKTSGITYASVLGIQKIKLAGAEKRMFARWGKSYSKEAELEYNPPLYLRLSSTIFTAIMLMGTIILYTVAIRSNVSVADYYAFNTAYAIIMAAFMEVVTIMPNLTDIRPTLEMIRPILEEEPEIHNAKTEITKFEGEIELSHVSFRYNDNMPNIIDDLSLSVAPGEYLAIVGSTGCGKSTLLRLLLGFETPQRGSIYFDRKDMSQINLESLRKKIGTIMQDSKLFLGDIYSNIVITAPHLTVKDAWEAAETAAIADDIRSMPMGMHTMISEGQGGVSGGQKQRLMIARAIVSKPKILMFDEATSALDNVTQKKVSEAIDKLKCTRIVIAHRLSTIRHADRIIYLDKGKIAEDGTYEELIAKNGLFAALVERQRLDV